MIKFSSGAPELIAGQCAVPFLAVHSKKCSKTLPYNVVLVISPLKLSLAQSTEMPADGARRDRAPLSAVNGSGLTDVKIKGPAAGAADTPTRLIAKMTTSMRPINRTIFMMPNLLTRSKLRTTACAATLPVTPCPRLRIVNAW
jgi:hypothetical protein